MVRHAQQRTLLVCQWHDASLHPGRGPGVEQHLFDSRRPASALSGSEARTASRGWIAASSQRVVITRASISRSASIAAPMRRDWPTLRRNAACGRHHQQRRSVVPNQSRPYPRGRFRQQGRDSRHAGYRPRRCRRANDIAFLATPTTIQQRQPRDFLRSRSAEFAGRPALPVQAGKLRSRLGLRVLASSGVLHQPPAGSYTFRVRVLSPSDPQPISEASLSRSSSSHTSIALPGSSPCASLAVVLAIWAAHRARVRRMHAAFRAVLEERARLAREMHDTLIQGCTSVSALLEACSSSQISDSTEQHELVDYARTQLAASIDEARQAVWNLRSEHGGDLGEEMKSLPIGFRASRTSL